MRPGSATRFLELLDSGLNARHDIVDTLKFSLLEKKGFAGTIQSLLPAPAPAPVAAAPAPEPMKVAAPTHAPAHSASTTTTTTTTTAVESRKIGLANPSTMIRAPRTGAVRRHSGDGEQLELQFFQFIRERARPGGPLTGITEAGSPHALIGMKSPPVSAAVWRHVSASGLLAGALPYTNRLCRTLAWGGGGLTQGRRRRIVLRHW
jgi:hypothetical protein